MKRKMSWRKLVQLLVKAIVKSVLMMIFIQHVFPGREISRSTSMKTLYDYKKEYFLWYGSWRAFLPPHICDNRHEE